MNKIIIQNICLVQYI